MSPSALPNERSLARYVPRVLRGALRHCGAGDVVEIAGAVLSVDVVGFTALTKSLSERGAAGAEQVQRRLTSAIGPVVRGVLDAGGDVISFGGDSVLVLFAAENADVATAQARASCCVASLRDRPARLPMRFGIAAGIVGLGIVGDPATRCQVVALGSTVRRAVAAQALAAHGELTVDTGMDVRRGELDLTARMATAGAAPASLQAFLPEAVAERLRAGRARLLPEHRHVTTVFVSADAALVFDSLQDWVCAALPIIHRAGGELRQVECGDKGPLLLAVFGAIRGLPDDEARGNARRDAVVGRAARVLCNR